MMPQKPAIMRPTASFRTFFNGPKRICPQCISRLAVPLRPLPQSMCTQQLQEKSNASWGSYHTSSRRTTTTAMKRPASGMSTRKRSQQAPMSMLDTARQMQSGHTRQIADDLSHLARHKSSHHRPASTYATASNTAENSQNAPDLMPPKQKHRHSNPIVMPQDACSAIAERTRQLPHSSLKRQLLTYLSLSKPRLTFLMVLTTASAYSLYPVPSMLLPAVTESPSLSTLTLVYLTAGTGLCSAAANSFNMIMEPEHDAKMSRTRNRPLVRGLISKRGAILFALATGTLGVIGLYIGVNPTVSCLGALNIFLYAGIYTPLKRVSVLNTWVGAIVGAIPPLMGWAAGAGQSATGSGDWKELLLGSDAAGGWLLATLLFAWQFHHFNALSWGVRHEYKHAGYRMLAWVNEAMNARVALRYALLCFPACWGLSVVGVTDWGFAFTSSVVNAWIARAAWQFYRLGGHKGSAKGLFWAGVWQLPSLLVLAMAHKKGLWTGLKNRYLGTDDFGEDHITSDGHGSSESSKPNET